MSNRGGGVTSPGRRTCCSACSVKASVASAERLVAFLSPCDLPAVEGTRSSVVGGGGGCRVVRAGWSSYPTGVLRARTYPSGHVMLVLVRRSSDAVDFYFKIYYLNITKRPPSAVQYFTQFS